MKGRDRAMIALDRAIQVMDLVKKGSSIPPAKNVFASVAIVLVTIRDSEPDHVELGLFCADVCEVLDRGVHGKKMDDLNASVCDAIGRLALTVEDIQRKLVKWGRRNVVSRRFHAKGTREKVASWRSDLDKILQVLNRELSTLYPNAAFSIIRNDVANTRTIASTTRNDVTNTRTIASGVWNGRGPTVYTTRIPPVAE